jgi:hypothetical protein
VLRSVQQPAGGERNSVHNADNVQFKYSDSEAGEGWDYSGHYANLKYFVVTKKMYADNPAYGTAFPGKNRSVKAIGLRGDEGHSAAVSRSSSQI